MCVFRNKVLTTTKRLYKLKISVTRMTNIILKYNETLSKRNGQGQRHSIAFVLGKLRLKIPLYNMNTHFK